MMMEEEGEEEKSTPHQSKNLRTSTSRIKLSELNLKLIRYSARFN